MTGPVPIFWAYRFLYRSRMRSLWRTSTTTAQTVVWMLDAAQRIGQRTLGTVNLTRWFMDGLTLRPNSAALFRLSEQDWTIEGIATQP